MKILREIVIYEKEGDRFIESFEINLSIEKLIEILNVDIDEDPQLYDVYEINKNQFLKLIELFSDLSKIDFDEVAVYYECCQLE